MDTIMGYILVIANALGCLSVPFQVAIKHKKESQAQSQTYINKDIDSSRTDSVFTIKKAAK